jgi:hypothetical protein
LSELPERASVALRVATGANPELPDLLAEVNARISEYAAGADSRGLTWEFVCECGAVECQHRVLLSLEEYEQLRQVEAPILANGHELPRSKQHIRRSREPVDEPAAPSAEAHKQVDRARRPLRHRSD